MVFIQALNVKIHCRLMDFSQQGDISVPLTATATFDLSTVDHICREVKILWSNDKLNSFIPVCDLLGVPISEGMNLDFIADDGNFSDNEIGTVAGIIRSGRSDKTEIMEFIENFEKFQKQTDKKIEELHMQNAADKKLSDRKFEDLQVQTAADKKLSDKKFKDIKIQTEADKKVSDKKIEDLKIQNELSDKKFEDLKIQTEADKKEVEKRFEEMYFADAERGICQVFDVIYCSMMAELIIMDSAKYKSFTYLSSVLHDRNHNTSDLVQAFSTVANIDHAVATRTWSVVKMIKQARNNRQHAKIRNKKQALESLSEFFMRWTTTATSQSDKDELKIALERFIDASFTS